MPFRKLVGSEAEPLGYSRCSVLEEAVGASDELLGQADALR